MTDMFISNGLATFNTSLSPKNDVTYTNTATAYTIDYGLGDVLVGDSSPSGTQYGSIVVVKTAFDSNNVTTSNDLIADDIPASLVLVGVNGATKVEIAGGLVTSLGDYLDGVERVYAFAIGGDGVNNYGQIWADGVKDNEGTAAAPAIFPLSLPPLTPVNAQIVSAPAATLYIDSAISSQDALTALIEQAIAGL